MTWLIKIFITLVSLLLLISCGGGGGGDGPVNYNSGPSSTGGTFLDDGTAVTYNSTTASNHQAYDAYENVTGSIQSSSQNPFDHINAYKAYGYGYSGDGKQIAIFDSGFDSDHYTYTGKTVSTYGTLTADDSDQDDEDYVGNNHGNFVTSIAAGYLDTSYSGTAASHGVAYDADIHLSSYDQKGSETYYPEQWANALDDASSAVVQNNSWGFTNTKYDSGTTYTSANLATYSQNGGLTANATSIDSYVTALNNFQDHGVIVFAVANDSSLDDVDIHVAMPEIYSQLNDAWINVVNVDITGSSGSESYTRESAPCGSTAKYCVAADGTYISGALDYTSGSSWFHTGGSIGSSFAAPQISGAIAIMAEAFSSQTPAQWTDRLLSSADNSMCTASGNVSFANGITHAYCSNYGHGVIDIYAALRPITSSRMAESILVGNDINSANVYSLNNSKIVLDKSFGDSISNALKGKNGVFYDALYGAFNYDFSKHAQSSNILRKSLLDSHMNENTFGNINSSEYGSPISYSYSVSLDKDNYLNTEDGLSYTTSYNDKNITASYKYPLEVALGFYSQEDIFNLKSNESFSVPYINESNLSYSFSSQIYSDDNTSINLAYMESDLNNVEKDTYVYSYTNKQNDFSFMGGLTNEKGGILKSSFDGAFELDQNHNPTSFIAIRKNKNFGDKEFGFISSFGSTNVKTQNNSLIKNIEGVITSSFGFYLNNYGLIDNKDEINISLSQPIRVESGNMIYDIPTLNDKSGTLNYITEETSLQPSGRQLDLSLRYERKFNDDLKFSSEGILTNNYNHTKNNLLDILLIGSIKYSF